MTTIRTSSSLFAKSMRARIVPLDDVAVDRHFTETGHRALQERFDHLGDSNPLGVRDSREVASQPVTADGHQQQLVSQSSGDIRAQADGPVGGL